MARAEPQNGLLRAAVVHARNDRIAFAARRHHFDRAAPVPFLCECSDVRCDELVRLTLEEYRRARSSGLRVAAPGHESFP